MSVTTNNPEALGWKYPNVGGISTRDGVITEWNDSLPELTQELVDSIEAEWTASEGHKADRRKSYPSLEEQMDILYHSGVEGLKTELKKTKDKYPKA
jgi:phage baseplate assembly protein gpV